MHVAKTREKGRTNGVHSLISEGNYQLVQSYAFTPGIYSDAQVEGWRKVTAAVHDAGGRIYLQLWHVGRISRPELQPDAQQPVAPSAIKPEGAQTFIDEKSGLVEVLEPRALSTDEIPGVVEQFRQGAMNAKRAGFDGVEIHGANGYLLDQFIRSKSNRRTDEYGGSIDKLMDAKTSITQKCRDIGYLNGFLCQDIDYPARSKLFMIPSFEHNFDRRVYKWNRKYENRLLNATLKENRPNQYTLI